MQFFKFLFYIGVFIIVFNMNSQIILKLYNTNFKFINKDYKFDVRMNECMSDSSE